MLVASRSDRLYVLPVLKTEFMAAIRQSVGSGCLQPLLFKSAGSFALVLSCEPCTCTIGVLLLGEGLLGFPNLLKNVIGTTGFSYIFLFTLFIGISIAFFQRTGAIQNFGDYVENKKMSRVRVQVTTWVMGMFIFFSDYLSPLSVGSTMRALSDKYRISREKLAYIADSTSAPVVILIPISGWAIFVAGLLVIAISVTSFSVTGSALIMEAFLASAVAAGIIMAIQGIPLSDIMDTVNSGIKGIMPAAMILIFAYALNTLSANLGTAAYIVSLTESWLTPGLLPAVTFLLAGVIAFSTGTSWGTFAIILPITARQFLTHRFLRQPVLRPII